MTLNFGGPDEKDDKEEEVFIQTLKAIEVVNAEEQFNVVGYGTISSFNSLDMASEVQGKLFKGRKDLKPGMKFKKGELMYYVNDTEARYTLRSRKSGFINIIAQMLPDIKVDFASEFDKWNTYIEDIKLNEPLPQLPSWKDNKEKIFISTRSVLTEYFAIKSMEEQLKKYSVVAPFNGVVSAVFISDQSVVNPGTKVLTFAQTDNFEVSMSVPVSSLKNIEVGTKGNIYTTTGELKGVGNVVRISEVINKSTQSIDVFIKPQALENESFIEGEYVKVSINESGLFKGVRVPNSAVKENKVFIFNRKDSTLTQREVFILDENEQGLFITGLKNKEVVITQEVLNYSDSTKYDVLIKK